MLREGATQRSLTPRPGVTGEVALHGLRGGHLPLELLENLLRVLAPCN
jgi:hypothetical protein